MKYLALLCVAAIGAQGYAWAQQGKIEAIPPTAAMKPLPELKGVTSWKTLAEVQTVKQKDKFVPQFSNTISALDKKEVKLQGFMMPLETGGKQKRFLLSAMPPECGFCLPGGPEQFVEVQAKSAVKYVMDPIVVSGRLVLVYDDAGGLLYRLIEAVPVEK